MLSPCDKCAMDFTGDIVGRLRDAVRVSVSYDEIPTWVHPAPAPLSLTPGDTEAKELPSSDTDSKTDEGQSVIVYIGEESLTLTNLLMTHSSSHVSLVG